ncbi:MAG: FN3 associated domain-containing protein, partial [Verrucomicrobiota bacterium]
DFVAMASRTLGSANGSPWVGPVALNEVMYHPAGDGDEYIELFNHSGATVPLFDPAYPTNTWQLDGAVEFIFPTNVSLASLESALVVGMDPAEFRTRNDIDPGIVIFGPWSGNLANEGESIKLYQPGDPEPDGFVPRILADRVKYNDRLPWPEAADGDGPSLERVDPSAYGNDACNWVAGTMGGTPAGPNNVSNLPSVAFAVAESVEEEGNRTVAVRVTLQPPSTNVVAVSYAATGGAAISGFDYTLTPGVLIFWPYDTEKKILVSLLDDSQPEDSETIELSLITATGALLGGQSRHVIRLTDADGGVLPAPQIMPASQSFLCELPITMTIGVAGAEIYYTTDGSTPDRSSKLYQGPFNLDESAKIKAIGYRDGYMAGGVTEAVYTLLAAGFSVSLAYRFINSELASHTAVHSYIY